MLAVIKARTSSSFPSFSRSSSVFNVCETAFFHFFITLEGIKESINEFVFEYLDGFSDSVVSAILEDKYKLNVLLKIADMGYEQYRSKLAKRDVIFSDVKNLVLAAAI